LLSFCKNTTIFAKTPIRKKLFQLRKGAIAPIAPYGSATEPHALSFARVPPQAVRNEQSV